IDEKFRVTRTEADPLLAVRGSEQVSGVRLRRLVYDGGDHLPAAGHKARLPHITFMARQRDLAVEPTPGRVVPGQLVPSARGQLSAVGRPSQPRGEARPLDAAEHLATSQLPDAKFCLRAGRHAPAIRGRYSIDVGAIAVVIESGGLFPRPQVVDPDRLA